MSVPTAPPPPPPPPGPPIAAAPPPPVHPYPCLGWRKARIVLGVATAFLFFFTIPGWVSLGSYRRWRDGRQERPGPILRAWSWAWPVVFVLAIVGATIDGTNDGQADRSDAGPMLTDDFSDPHSGWVTVDDRGAAAGYTAGAYRIQTKRASDVRFSDLYGDRSSASVDVGVDAWYADASPSGLFGVGCLSVDHDNAYDFVIDPAKARWMILRSGSNRATPLRAGRDTDGAILKGSSNRVTGLCDGGPTGASATLTLFVNGTEIGSAVDDDGVGPFDGIELAVFSIREGGVEAMFDRATLTEHTGYPRSGSTSRLTEGSARVEAQETRDRRPPAVLTTPSRDAGPPRASQGRDVVVASLRRRVGVMVFVSALALGGLLAVPAPAGAGSTVTDSEVSVGSPHDIAPRSHQNEPAVAIDAHQPNVLVAGSNDYIDQQPCPEDISHDIAQCDEFSAGIGVSGVYFSFDSGETWMQPTYTGWQARDCGTATVCPGSFGPIGRIPWYYEAGLIDDGDPAVAIGPKPVDGTFSWDNGSRVYYANLTSRFPGATGFPRGFEAVAVSRLDDPTPSRVQDKANWYRPVIATAQQSNTAFTDKEQIWVDNASSSPFFGRAYVCYAEFRSKGHHNPGTEIAPLTVLTSSDGGDTWRSKQVQPADAGGHGQSGFGSSGCTVRTSSDGTVYVFAEQFENPLLSGLPTHGKQVMFRSTDGGMHWSKAKTLFTITDPCFFQDPLSGRCVMDGYTGARTDLAGAPSVDIANGAPTGADATNFIIDSWADASSGLNHEKTRVAWSSDGGSSWHGPTAVSLPGDRPMYAAPAISPSGDRAYVVYEAVRSPWEGDDVTTPRPWHGVFLSAAIGAGGPGAWDVVYEGPTADLRSSFPGHRFREERVGDYVYAAASRDYGVGLWIDVRNAAVCPAIQRWRAASLAQGSIVLPAPWPLAVCPATWGNMDVWSATTG